MTDDEPKADLSLVSIDELVQELMDRHDGLILVRESNVDVKGARSDVYFDFSGGVSRCIGLCERMKAHLINRDWEQDDDENEDDDDDE